MFQDIAPMVDRRFEGSSFIISLDTKTPEWMEKTFVEEFKCKISSTIYICGNQFSAKKLDSEMFTSLEEVWRSNWNAKFGTVLRKDVTDRAIIESRQKNPDRLIVHYMQPHWPFVPAMDVSEGRGMSLPTDGNPVERGDGKDVWGMLRDGEVDVEGVWEGYQDNLRYVLEEVAVLLDNIDAQQAVITSDHGNAKGEWGIYDHPIHMPLKCLRKVPWVETQASDKHTREPTDESNSVDTTQGIEDRLKSLGYM
jgi:hypothetical protein